MGDRVDTTTVVPALDDAGLRPDDTVGVFASGSMVRGWGNAMSDVDVHVVTRSQHEASVRESAHVALDPDSLGFERIFVAGRRWDVEYWTASQVEQLLAKVTWDAYDGGDAPWSTLSKVELGMLERLPFAQAAEGEGLDGQWLDDVQARLAASAHRTVLTGLSLREADGLLEDAAGQLEAGDLRSAVIAVKLAFAHTADALQASEGQFGSLWPKWRARRMELVETPLLSLEEFWRVETMADYDESDPARWVEKTIRLCRSVGGQLEV